MDNEAFRVALNGLAMHLRRTELESVAAGLGELDSSAESKLITLAEALRQLPANDRAPAWELVVRRFGRHKPLAVAAGDIGLDVIVARALLECFAHNVAPVPLGPGAPEASRDQ